MVFVTLPFLVVIIVTLWLWWYIKRHRFLKHLERFPGPPPTFILGNALEVGSPSTILPAFARFHENYGETIKLLVGPFEVMLITTERRFLEFIFTSSKLVQKSRQYTHLRSWLGTGLVLADGGLKWYKHRKLLTPAFHFGILKHFIKPMEDAGQILVRKLSYEVENASTNIYPYISLCALDIICETAMGTSVNAQTYSETNYVRSVKTMCRIIVDRAFHPVYSFKLFYYLSPLFLKELKAVKILHNYTNAVIRRRKQRRSSEESAVVEGETKTRKKALMDILLDAEKGAKLSHEDIRQEVDTFLFAGHDTTASAMSFALYYLAHYPDVQEKEIEELKEIFADDRTRPATMNDLHNMAYLELIIKETLRLYPSVPYYARELTEDIKYDGTILPKGLTVVVNAYGMHRRADLFENPKEFRPERFENLKFNQPFDYIPFSAGSRNCIGQKFAVLEMKLILSILLRNFEFLPATPRHQLKIVAETVIKSENGVCVQLKNRIF